MPQAVIDLGPAIDLDCRFRTTCALLSEGGVACWGDNAFGQLGVATPATSAHAIDVALP